MPDLNNLLTEHLNQAYKMVNYVVPILFSARVLIMFVQLPDLHNSFNANEWTQSIDLCKC